jgi:fibronectin type 3 domain-containing protein
LKHLGDTLICRQLGTGPMSSCHQVGEVTPPKGPQRKKGEPDPKIRMTYTDTLPELMEDENPAGFATYAVEIMNDRFRSAGLSNQVVIPLAPTIAPPPDISATVSADGVTVSWSGGVIPTAPAGLNYVYRIERRPAGSGGYIALNDVEPEPEGSYLDRTSGWEQKYEYRITTVTEVRSNGRVASVEGDDSPPAEVFTKDIYPPAQPTGVQAVFSSIGQKPFIDLTWAPNLESDLAGYAVFRRSNGGQWQKLNAEPVKIPSFRDENVQPGTKYQYAVSAVDLRGNESPRSVETSEVVPSTQ